MSVHPVTSSGRIGAAIGGLVGLVIAIALGIALAPYILPVLGWTGLAALGVAIVIGGFALFWVVTSAAGETFFENRSFPTIMPVVGWVLIFAVPLWLAVSCQG